MGVVGVQIRDDDEAPNDASHIHPELGESDVKADGRRYSVLSRLRFSVALKEVLRTDAEGTIVVDVKQFKG
jgi:hypothetical protein